MLKLFDCDDGDHFQQQSMHVWLQFMSYSLIQAECLATLLSHDLDLKLGDYAGDTAQRVAEIYNQTDCLEVIKEHLRQQAEGSPKERSPKERSPKHRGRSPRPKSPRPRSPSTWGPMSRSPGDWSPKDRSPKPKSPKDRTPKPQNPKASKERGAKDKKKGEGEKAKAKRGDLDFQTTSKATS